MIGLAKRLSAACLVVAVLPSAAAGQTNSGDLDRRVDLAVAAGTRFLLAQIGPDGKCLAEFAPEDRRRLFGGRTALCAYALLTAGADPNQQQALAKALEWLEAADLQSTYAVSMRACAFGRLKDKRVLPLLERDVRWLIAAGRDGAYTYTSGDAPAEEYDNSNSMMAVLGVRAGQARGVEVPAGYWQSVQRHWIAQQQPDGGWGYRVSPRFPHVKTYGSMTAGGLASLFVCAEQLGGDHFIRCAGGAEDKPIAEGLGWLERNISLSQHPGKGVEWYCYWLFWLQRVGLASGHKHFGGRDWYAQGAAELLSLQRDDGGWGYGDRVADTGLAMLFLVRGRSPVLMNKLRYEGKWNSRPRDAANLTAWLGETFERPIGWQIVSAGSPHERWLDAPILYVSGAGPWEPTDQQVEALRQFVWKGGLILSEAACNNGDFTLDMQRTLARLFPGYPLRRLPDDHPVYSIQFAPGGLTGLTAVSNGIRPLAIHAPRELSLAMQLPQAEASKPMLELAANICLLATDKGSLPPRGAVPWPLARQFAPRATVRLARIKYRGNYAPEPLAWARQAVLMGNRYRIRLETAGPMDIADLDAARWPVAHMTGTEEFSLTAQESAALGKYLADGGTLVVDAAGGSRTFAAAAEKQLQALLPEAHWGQIALGHRLYLNGPEPITAVSFRRDYALALGPGRNEPRLRGLVQGERLAVIYSPEDLTAGLVGYPCYKLRGYSPESATQLMAGILWYAAGLAGAGSSQ